MNVIIIMLDSMRQDGVSFYNQGKARFDDVEACKTPNIDTFAKKCVVFENAYPGGLPTLPVRQELMTGQFTLPYRGWAPLNPDQITITDVLRREGHVCGLIADTYHLFKPNMNYHKGFHSFQWIRGQEYDAYTSSPPRQKKLEDYVKPNFPEEWKMLVQQFLANTDDFVEYEDWFPAKVTDKAIDWLEKNRSHEKVFLWIDSFDPHEPWDFPKRFDTYTDQSYDGPRLILPMGGYANQWATPEEIAFIRGLYFGEVSFVDHCLGRLFSKLEELGYYDDSIVVLLADHGHPLADHGKFLKGPDRVYSELLKVPFMIRFPECKPRVAKALVQFHDLLPTLLVLMGLQSNIDSMHGKSFSSVLFGDSNEHREATITGYYEHLNGPKGARGADRCIRNQEWSYIQRPIDQTDELYNLTKDPNETRNMIDERPEIAKKLASLFGSYFRPPAMSRTVKGTQGKYELEDTGVV